MNERTKERGRQDKTKRNLPVYNCTSTHQVCSPSSCASTCWYYAIYNRKRVPALLRNQTKNWMTLFICGRPDIYWYQHSIPGKYIQYIWTLLFIPEHKGIFRDPSITEKRKKVLLLQKVLLLLTNYTQWWNSSGLFPKRGETTKRWMEHGSISERTELLWKYLNSSNLNSSGS